mmetsp:Transcript_47394/g.152683  ORF Transcript_47394/g.152683 Transcript_47394/m.152683 type:complete len:339 (-) Transcript_47394:1022-2038(-)
MSAAPASERRQSVGSDSTGQPARSALSARLRDPSGGGRSSGNAVPSGAASARGRGGRLPGTGGRSCHALAAALTAAGGGGWTARGTIANCSRVSSELSTRSCRRISWSIVFQHCAKPQPPRAGSRPSSRSPDKSAGASSSGGRAPSRDPLATAGSETERPPADTAHAPPLASSPSNCSSAASSSASSSASSFSASSSAAAAIIVSSASSASSAITFGEPRPPSPRAVCAKDGLARNPRWAGTGLGGSRAGRLASQRCSRRSAAGSKWAASSCGRPSSGAMRREPSPRQSPTTSTQSVKVSEKLTRKKRMTGTQMQRSSTNSWPRPMPELPVSERPKYE